MGGSLYFTICALVALGTAIATVTVRSPLRAAMALLFHILTLAALFLLLHSHLLAALQLLVYAGAIVVLFVFVIMLVGPSATIEATRRGLVTRSVAGSTLIIVVAALAFGVATIDAEPGEIAACDESTHTECSTFGGVRGLSREIFGSSASGTIGQGALVPFELISILLLVAIVGAIAVARGRNRQEVKSIEERKKHEANLAEHLESAPEPSRT